ncbi:MAG TPA: enoyl-CoA hydratase/isomerase family protein [Acidimicrobiales bacterium]|nr:enoyl-CoA hydratase/isomerase family protein [Acidimicrobiales bacterium]
MYGLAGISVTANNAVRVITLDRPDELNAFSGELHDSFVQLWSRLRDDTDARAVVLTGAGRAFSAGGSYADFERRRVDLDFRQHEMDHARDIVMGMIDCPLPVVAAVNGPAVGLGCTVATLCDVVFMADGAFLADPHVSVALVAGDGSAVSWPAHTSLLKAKQYLLTGDRIPAEAAVSIGMANFVVPRDKLLDAALAFAHRLAAQPPQAVRESKRILNEVLRRNAERALQSGLDAEYASHDTPEYAASAEAMKPKP